jgi:Fe(3+) dicitrate transport protein
MKSFFTLIIILLVICQLAQGQRHINISGQVVAEGGMVIENAHVSLTGTNFGATSDVDGKFILKGLTPGTHEIIVTHQSYETTKIRLNADSVYHLSIVLKDNLHLLSQVYVVSSRDRLFNTIPGSVSYLDKSELVLLKPISGNEVFRRVSGLNVVDEEGAGLRANIGIRGLDPDRSRNVLMLEDGIPVALSPYGEPEMYYTPAMDRMSGVEVLKGSGQILYGPQTVGGVINYITADPPEEQEIGIRLQGGSGGYFSGLASYGNTFNNTGFQATYLRKQATDLGPTNFTINDFSLKMKTELSERSTLGIKLAAYNEVSNSTYIGITQRMYDIGGNDYTVMMPNDELDVKRYMMSLYHQIHLTKDINLQSTLFGYSTVRNWRRQDYVYNSYTNGILNPPPANWTGVVWGDESVAGGAIYPRNRTGNRDRQFEVAGWEQKLNYTFMTGNMQNNLTAGYRLMFERAYEQRINGSTAEAKSGALVSDEIRTGKALALYFIDKIQILPKLEITPGLRAEFYNYEREILREANVDTFRIAENSISEFIPGVGMNYRPSTRMNIFTGIHRGYAPPRVKDAINFSAENPVLDLKAESSWNFELGLRSQIYRGIYAELAYFYMNFENQIIPSSQSIGGVGFGVTNAGKTLHSGLEAAIYMNSSELLDTDWRFMFDLNATYIRATYNSDRIVTSSGNDINVNGNRLPYAPEWTMSSAFTVEAPFGTGIRLTNTYVGSQFTDELNTVTPSNNGRIGLMPQYNVLDASLFHELPKLNTRFNVSVKNLMNERYISTRRPEGIRVGLPRIITAGIEVKF